MQSIPRPHPEYNATGAALDRQAAERGQLRADADDGIALLNALSLKWYEQGYTAGRLSIDPAMAGFWTPDHARGYADALAGYQLQLFEAGAPALYR